MKHNLRRDIYFMSFKLREISFMKLIMFLIHAYVKNLKFTRRILIHFNYLLLLRLNIFYGTGKTSLSLISYVVSLSLSTYCSLASEVNSNCT